MAESLVRAATERGVLRLTLDRPRKRNALTRELIRQLHDQVSLAADQDAVRLVVLAALGPAFCAGMDLAEMQERAAHPQATKLWHEDTQAYRDLLAALVTLPKPTLTVVQGPALAGGLGLALACDLVLASETATFGLPEPQRGLTAAVVSPLVCYRAGVGAASYALLSGKTLSADQALRCGFCHEVVPPEELSSQEETLCRAILTGAPAALAATKNHLLNTAGRELLSQLDAGLTLSAQARETNDAREGLAAFLEKRSPGWFPVDK